MKKLAAVLIVLVLCLNILPVDVYAADAATGAPTGMWVAPSETNGIPAQIDVFQSSYNSRTRTYCIN